MTERFPVPPFSGRDPDMNSLLRKHRETVARALAEFSEGPVPPFSERDADDYFMGAALALARLAAAEGEVPVGCVIVRDGKILAGDCNGREAFKNALWHAETAAVDQACRALGGWRLPGCTLYVTLEPCPMCAGAIWNARIPRVVIGAKDARAGAMGSLLNLASYPLYPKPEVVFGVREQECLSVLRSFFAERRK